MYGAFIHRRQATAEKRDAVIDGSRRPTSGTGRGGGHEGRSLDID